MHPHLHKAYICTKASIYHIIVNAFLDNYMKCKTQVMAYGRMTLL